MHGGPPLPQKILGSRHHAPHYNAAHGSPYALPDPICPYCKEVKDATHGAHS